MIIVKRHLLKRVHLFLLLFKQVLLIHVLLIFQKIILLSGIYVLKMLVELEGPRHHLGLRIPLRESRNFKLLDWLHFSLLLSLGLVPGTD